MKILVKSYLLITCLLLVGYCSHAKGIKYGKFSKDEILLSECSYETDAVAVILSKTCVVDVSYRSIIYHHHVRIKILKEEGLDKANVELPYWRKDGLEKITSVKGHTINFDENKGKEVTDLDGKSVFDVDLNESYGAVRFGMPNVKVGSIIEYKYALVSNFYSYLDTWYFQNDIPTLYSSIKANIPDSFRYNQVSFGQRLRAKYPSVTSNEWILTNLSSIKEEPYVNNYMDFVEQIRFQLTGYYKNADGIAGGIEFVTVKSTWDKLAREYLEAFDFFGRKAYARKIVDQILVGGENNWEKLEKIYDYVRTHVKWDGEYRLYPKKTAPRILEEKVASNSEINYLLVLLLREAGIKAEPALTRTNNLGLLQKSYPLMSQFNQALAYVEIFGKKLFLNATSLHRPYQLLGEKDLNYFALVIEKNKVRWEKVLAFTKSRQHLVLNYDFTNKDEPSCMFKIIESGYYAEKSRKSIKKYGLEEFLKAMVDESEVELNKDSVQIVNVDKVSKPLEITCKLPMTDMDFESDMIYFEPFPNVITENPFIKEDRQYRIDFNYYRYQSILINLKLPKDYRVEDAPKSKVIRLSNGFGKYLITTQNQGNVLQMRTLFEIKKTQFSKEYYRELRELFTHMLSSIKQQVVIQKNNTLSEK
ncbi:DUF3857 and transglutaminase domain-containing protein [Marinifilum sp. D714]|uniref:DUF3857 and transglutaminase domain-containing protein n=1 Tax=Marinifilum sp. D714 TaxID=2937523 RepID=UPI0027CCDC06|nr:DUF3857 and transglutaminase domain-containing protein [Marinifilum sp. D714]MDQ2180261.1 DUF3857 and transglutaminase domain-containing protein [Marinifilum sp. D714]